MQADGHPEWGEGEAPDIFLLYNEKEETAARDAEELRSRGVTVYFYRDDFPLGGAIDDAESRLLRSARAVVVLIGSKGWGPTQQRLAERAIALEKKIIPVLVGKAPPEALDQVGGLFRERRWVDLEKEGPGGYDQIVKAVLGSVRRRHGTPPPASPRFDNILNILIDGNDWDRFALIENIRRYPIAAAAALAERIRTSVREDFSPGQEVRSAITRRAPTTLPATRSWMLSALIWLEPESKETRTLLLMHLRSDVEHSREVRFWVLAGMIQRNLSYLPDGLAQAREDPAPEVSGLARIAAAPEDENTLHAFRTALQSERFLTAWSVLRILRRFPVPALAADVVVQLDRIADGKPLTYDALFALATPAMAEAAKPEILKHLGLERFAELVIAEARESTPIARDAFARLFCVFDQKQARGALLRSAASSDERQLVQRMLDEMATTSRHEDEWRASMAGVASETIDITKDDIDIRADVDTLASVILARDVTPPLAIGLFGPWGSGKSFFMRSIEASAAGIAAEAGKKGDERFCSEVVHIKFNAWHYVDTSLWANLVSHVLAGLSEHLNPGSSAAEREAAITADLVSVKAEESAAEAERVRWAEQVNETAQKLEKATLERERREIKLRDLRAGDLVALLDQDKELNATVKSALKDVGAPAALESAAELNKVVEESYTTAGRAAALFVSLLKGPNVRLILAGIVIVLVVPPLAALGIKELLGAYAAQLSELTATAALAAGSVAVVLRRGLSSVKAGLDSLSAAKRKVDERLAEMRSVPTPREEELQKQLGESRAAEKAAAERLAAATARAQELENRVALLRESRTLGFFVKERSASDDYRRHLGLISTIRKDFDELVSRLKSGNSGPRKVDRIILYIDDVDRCPPKMVVDILEAVHLLLAYELFVVVVSVDPRWLLRSLESRFTHLKQSEAAASDAWGATAQDYLEKIFQIPFSVRPMGERGFGRLMQRLLPAGDGPGTVTLATPIDGNAPAAGDASSVARSDTEQPPAPSGATADEVQDRPAAAPAAEPQTAKLEALAESLAISRAEAAFAETLHMLIETPRSARRFANIYRLLKASLPHGELTEFEGTEGVPGEFQLPMLLLASLVGNPRAAAKLFPDYLQRARAGELAWWDLPDEPRHSQGEEGGTRAVVAEIVGRPLFPAAPSLVEKWLPRVARYSFTTARMFLESGESRRASSAD